MKKRNSRQVSGGVALLALTIGCGADSVDIGDRPDPIGGGSADSPDAGGSEVDSPRCNIPNLGQYRLLFDSDGGGLERRIYSMRADGTQLEALTPVEELAREPALSPDGIRLAYATPEGIRVKEMASGLSEPLTAYGDMPEWAPDSASIYYRARDAGGGCIVNRKLGDEATDEYLVCATVSAFDLTPDGLRVVYTDATYQSGVEVGHMARLLEPATDGSQLVVPATPISVDQPTVSPDGVWVAAAYGCASADTASLWTHPLQVTTPPCEGRRITAAGSPSATNPQWGPGTLIVYERGEPPRDLAVIAADTGEECVIQGPGDDRNPTWGIFPTIVPK